MTRWPGELLRGGGRPKTVSREMANFISLNSCCIANAIKCKSGSLASVLYSEEGLLNSCGIKIDIMIVTDPVEGQCNYLEAPFITHFDLVRD